jgi:hypothetical protein
MDQNKKSIYEEVDTLVSDLKKERPVPTLNKFVYLKRELCEDNSAEPRFQLSFMLKRLF